MVFLHTRRRQSRFAQGRYTTCRPPIRTDFAGRRLQYSFGVSLVVQFACDFSDPRQTADVGHVARRGRRHCCSGELIAAGLRGCQRRGGCRFRILRFNTGRDIQALQILVPFFLARKQLLNALQALDGFGTHPVLHQNFSLQHQVLQRSRSQGWLRSLDLLFFLLHRRKARGDDVEALIIDLSPQRLQASVMSGLVGIHFRRPVQTLSSFLVIVFGAVEIEQLQQRLRIIGLAVGSVKQLCQKFQHFCRWTVRRQQFLHRHDERSPLATPPLERFQLPG